MASLFFGFLLSLAVWDYEIDTKYRSYFYPVAFAMSGPVLEGRMKFGIIGGGMIAAFHAKAIKAISGSSLHAVYARSADKAEAFAKEYGCEAFTDLDAFLDSGIDAVTIATPSGYHMEPTLAAAKAGKHVICEKPLEVTVERIDQMVSACRDANVTLSGIFNRRFNRGVEVLKDAVDTGRFGKLTLCSAYIKWFRTQEYYDSGAWRGTWALDGGGAVMNQGIHTVDQLIYLAGNVKAVCAFADCLAHERIEVEDTAVAVLEFENGAMGTIEASTACYSKAGHPAQVQICGTTGSAFLQDDKITAWDFLNENPEDDEIRKTLSPEAEVTGLGAADPSAINFEGHRLNFEDALKAIQEGREPSINGVEARRSIAVIQALYTSAKEGGKRIEV